MHVECSDLWMNTTIRKAWESSSKEVAKKPRNPRNLSRFKINTQFMLSNAHRPQVVYVPVNPLVFEPSVTVVCAFVNRYRKSLESGMKYGATVTSYDLFRTVVVLNQTFIVGHISENRLVLTEIAPGHMVKSTSQIVCCQLGKVFHPNLVTSQDQKAKGLGYPPKQAVFIRLVYACAYIYIYMYIQVLDHMYTIAIQCYAYISMFVHLFHFGEFANSDSSRFDN